MEQSVRFAPLKGVPTEVFRRSCSRIGSLLFSHAWLKGKPDSDSIAIKQPQALAPTMTGVMRRSVRA